MSESGAPKLLLQITLHNIKIKLSSKIALETTLILEVNGVEQSSRMCPISYADSQTRVIQINHVLRIRIDDRTAKRSLVIKVNATKDGQQKLVAMHAYDLELKTKSEVQCEFQKCIDKEGYLVISQKLLAVKGYKQQSVNASFLTQNFEVATDQS